MRFSLTSLVLLAGMAGFLPGPVTAKDEVLDSPVSSVDSSQMNGALKSLLVIASSDDKNASDQIEHQLQTLLPKMGDDPRLHYVHALSLLKQFRHAEAVQAIQSAAGHKLYYFPAHHYLIYEQIRQKQYDEAIESLVDLAERIGEPSQLWISEEDRLEAARWLGRMIGFLEGPCGNSDAAKKTKQCEPALRMLTGPVYETELNHGFDELHTEHRNMQKLLLMAIDTAVQRNAAELKRAEEKQLELDAHKKSVATSSREQSAINKEQLREYESQLKALEKKFEALQVTESTLIAAITSVRLEIIQLPIYANAASLNANYSLTTGQIPGGQYTVALSAPELSAALALKNLELQKYIFELQLNSSKKSETLAKAGQLIESGRQWQFANDESEARTQDTFRRLSRWEQRLAKSKKIVLQNSDKRAAVVQSRINLISSYDSMNVLEEIADLEQSVTEAELGH